MFDGRQVGHLMLVSFLTGVVCMGIVFLFASAWSGVFAFLGVLGALTLGLGIAVHLTREDQY